MKREDAIVKLDELLAQFYENVEVATTIQEVMNIFQVPTIVETEEDIDLEYLTEEELVQYNNILALVSEQESVEQE